MEVDLTSSDDPPECHDQCPDDDTFLDHGLPVGLTHQLPVTASCMEHCDQDEMPAEESGSEHRTTDGKASGKSSSKMQQGAVFSGKILSFCCSECKDDTTYSPNDLLKHFQGEHKGTLPTYPCDLCSFVTNTFSYLQTHRIEHRNTLVTCDICNDGGLYSLLLLTKHFTNCHSRNGHFDCTICEFSTRDAGTFVQHIHHHNEHNHKQEEQQRHTIVGSGTFPFMCQICGYFAARRDYLNKHLTAAHGEEMDKASKWRANEDSFVANSPGLKLLLKKSPTTGSREPQWMSKLNSLPGVELLDHSGKLYKPEKTLEGTQQFLERAVGVKKESQKWTKSPLKIDPSSTQPKLQECETSPRSGLLNPPNSNGLTVLMVKNKISIPPNCSTKVIGFKMVDGKKHLVLKVIQTKQPDSTETDVSGEDEDKTTSSSCSSSSPRTETVLKKDVTDESQGNKNDTSSPIHQANFEAHSPSANDETTQNSTVLPRESRQSNGWRPYDHEKRCNNEIQSAKSPASLSKLLPVASQTTVADLTRTSSEAKTAGLSLVTNESQRSKLNSKPSAKSNTSTLEHKTPSKPAEISEKSFFENLQIGSGNNSTLVDVCSGDSKAQKNQSVQRLLRSSARERNSDSDKVEVKSEFSNLEGVSASKLMSHKEAKAGPQTTKASPVGKDHNKELDIDHLSSPSQEVFSFHNYSKDTSGSSPDSLQCAEDFPQELEEEECEEDFGDWSLTLPDSPCSNDNDAEKPEASSGSPRDGEHHEKALERVSDSDIEVDECIATVDDSLLCRLSENEDDGLPAAENTQKVGGDDVATKAASANSASVLGQILEKHSDAIISKQLEKDRLGSSTTGTDKAKPTKTMLRILQTPEGKQKMFLQTEDKPYAVPVQLKGGAGFQLITKSCSPQINVSYVKPGMETASKSSGVALTLNGGRLGLSTKTPSADKKDQSGSQGANGNCFMVNSGALKGSLLFSGAVTSPSVDQAPSSPPTCYLVKRPSPVSDSTAPASKVLAMPVNGRKTSPLPSGRQAYLVRYISPATSSILSNNECKSPEGGSRAKESGKNRVFLKILRGPNGARFLSTAPYTTDQQPLYLATGSLQSPCLLMSSGLTNVSTGFPACRLVSPQARRIAHLAHPPDVPLKARVELEPSPLSRPVRSQSQRKRRQRALFEDLLERSSKSRRLSKSTVKDSTSVWEPAAKDVVRTLRLCPFSPLQEVKCPRRNQPVVVLNHPDADVPEVASIMKSVNKYKGDVLKVSLSPRTVQALSHPDAFSKRAPRSIPADGTARERFILKMKLKKTSRNKYEVVRSLSAASEQPKTFRCWFCGRAFTSQEDWIGHGQRHLMEATRDWNKLF